MTVLLDMDVHSPSEAKNLAFARLVTKARIQAMYDAVGSTDKFDMYHFQNDDPTLVGSLNNGTGGFLGNMAWTHASLGTGAGWYAPHRGWPSPGMTGRGMVGVGGADVEVGSVTGHTGNIFDGLAQATFLFKVKMDGTGGGGAGRIGEAAASYIIFASAANTLAISIYDGGAWHSNSTGANLVYGEWHDLAIVFDGSLAGDLNRCKLYLDGIDVTTVVTVGMPAAMVDPGAVRYILNGFTAGVFNRAWDGAVGLYGTYPGLAMSQAQIQSMIEIRGLFQPTVANQPVILTPGGWNTSDYDFSGSAPSDYLLSRQAIPVKTDQGSLLMWFGVDSFAAGQTLIWLGESGLTQDEFVLYFEGTVAGDPMSIYHFVNGAISWQGSFASNVIVPNNNFIAITSDAVATRAYHNGEEQVVADSIGANSGQWFGSATDANALAIAALARAAVQGPLNGTIAKVIIRDDVLSPIQIAKMAQSSALGWARQY